MQFGLFVKKDGIILQVHINMIQEQRCCNEVVRSL